MTVYFVCLIRQSGFNHLMWILCATRTANMVVCRAIHFHLESWPRCVAKTYEIFNNRKLL